MSNLSATRVKTAKPAEKPYKLFDGDGLYLEVRPNGGKWWRFRYRLHDKQKLLSLGTYPDTSLAKARTELATARQQVADGIDPSEIRKQDKAKAKFDHSNTFKDIAGAMITKMSADKWVPEHATRNTRRLELNVFPWIGKKPIADVTAGDIIDCMERVSDKGHRETANRIFSLCNQTFRFAVAKRLIDSNPCRDIKPSEILPEPKVKHHAAITNPDTFGQLLKAIDTYGGGHAVCSAFKLAPLLFVRPGELRKAQWVEIDLDKAEWRFTASKSTGELIVPLSTQAVAILEDLKPLTGHRPYVFPSAKKPNEKPMSDAALERALVSVGFTSDIHTVHGFRATARTLLDEVLEYRPDLIEHQLGHVVRDPNGRAYNRTKYLSQRKEMMQAWSDYLVDLKNG